MASKLGGLIAAMTHDGSEHWNRMPGIGGFADPTQIGVPGTAAPAA